MRDILIMIVTVVACTTIAIPVILAAQSLGVDPSELQGAGFKLSWKNMLTVFSYAGIVIGFVLAAWAFGHKARVRDLGFRAHLVRDMGLGLLVGSLLAGVQLGLSCALAEGVTSRVAIPSGTSPVVWAGYYLFFLVFFLSLNSFKEELVYRTYVLEATLRYTQRVWVACVGSAVLFSLVHHILEPFTWTAFLTRFTFGALAAVVYLSSRSIWAVVGLHSGSNLLFLTFSENWKLGALVHLDVRGGNSVLERLVPTVVLGACVLIFWACPRFLARLFPSRVMG